MATPSHRETTGISISIFSPSIDPSVPTYIPEGQIATRLDDFTSYSHTIAAVGGYWQSQIVTTIDELDIETWLQSGINKHVEVYDSALQEIWEGFINEIVIDVAGLSVRVGPLLDVGNRVRLEYAVLDTTTNPPTSGIRTTTAWVEDAVSQSRYGYLVQTLSCDGASAAEALARVELWLSRNAQPRITNALGSSGAQGGVQLTLNCLGYVQRLTYPYNQWVNSGTQDLSAKLGDVLDADPNGLFSSANADITTNTLQVAEYEGEDRRGWDILKALAASGDALYNQYNLGVYANRRVIYEPVTEQVYYHQHLSENGQRISTVTGQTIEPWHVLPGRWILTPDILPGTTQPTDLFTDPRAMFIEKVTYSVPYNIQLSGAKHDVITARLAQYGLSGIGG